MDSLVVVLVILASSFENSYNKFYDDFAKADSAFNKEVIINKRENKYEKLFNEVDSSLKI